MKMRPRKNLCLIIRHFFFARKKAAPQVEETAFPTVNDFWKLFLLLLSPVHQDNTVWVLL